MLRLEGYVNGQPVSADCENAESATLTAAALLPVVDGSRLLFILATLRLSALSGRTWAWSGEGFALRLGRVADA